MVPFSTEIPEETKKILVATGRLQSRTLAGQGRYILNQYAEGHRIIAAAQ